MRFSIARVENRPLQEAAYRVRTEVFVKEQKVPDELELDELDEAAETIHFVVQDEGGNVVGTARIRPTDDHNTAKVERVAVVASKRKNGIGKALMRFLEDEAVRSGFTKLKLNAQTHARRFYEDLGYSPKGSLFFEAGIEHITMYKTLDSARS
ncbi:GNAT family N-acetyltransferase [Alicyclobacillus sp. SO9]|uniref:GNAT family N-acetyltransferase n=1 Tax=Alicyclobacillus sp. SO9 TaxID=2665646 RepID=UPI0018E77BB1|nr:GNAT family N-acetyltransferase [Alicyclobacillus sp. SO9]QQE80112.1 GNAT family N-acetyltransferase [Alicyclobacillus sp. SO9]